MEELPGDAQRRRAIAWATSLPEPPFSAPSPDEGALPEPVQHVLYGSRATYPLGPAQLTQLLEHARGRNEALGLTGLLCYSEGHFVQVLEGAPGPLHRVYAQIQQDPRHEQVATLSQGPGPRRWFPDWRMAYVQLRLGEFQWMMSRLEGKRYLGLVPPQRVQHAHLLTLLEAFTEPRRSAG
jgi:hypothetical protein